MTGRGLRGRRTAWVMISAAVLLIGFVVFVVVAAPHTMGPEPGPLAVFMTWIGVAMALGGLIWMIRIYRASLDPEAHPSAWRSRGR